MATGRKTGGRTKGVPNRATRDIKALAQKYTPDALKTLVEICKRGESEQARVAASKELLDRGHGKSPQPQTGEGGVGPVALEISWLQPSA